MELQKLSEEDFNYIGKIIEIWKKHEKEFRKLEFEEKRNYITKLAIEHLKQKYPNAKYKVLDYKGNLELLKDNVAIHLQDDKPELYIYLTLNGPLLFDSFKYDAYEKGPFEKPDWENIFND